VRALAPHIAAMDIAELNPLYDTPARATALLAARLMLNAITVRVQD
jgi:arginase family enzyme